MNTITIIITQGFVPLWAGLASEAQASRVCEMLTDPRKFDTKVPFPCMN